MPSDVRHADGLIGPNAILQLLPILDHAVGPGRRAQLLARAGIFEVPDGSRMICETDAARLHRQLRLEEADAAPNLAELAGTATGDYILRNRIPGPAQAVLKVIPASVSAFVLSRAIARNAWTFVGSGNLHVASPTVFVIEDNPLVAGEHSEHCLCKWHEGVFARLYQVLVEPEYTCREVCCRAQGFGNKCRFELQRDGQKQA